MTPGTELFRLIKSLSKSEQRYISLALKQNVRKNYGRLFSIIAAQDSYNEQFIKQVYKKELFVKQFAFTKNYLHNFILKQLRNYYDDSVVNVGILNKLIDIEILMYKGFYKQAYSRAKSVLALANEQELLQLELVVHSNIRRIFLNGKIEMDTNTFKRKEKKTLDMLHNLNLFEHIAIDVHVNNLRHGTYYNDKSFKKLQLKFKEINQKPKSLSAQWTYLNTIISIYGNKRIFNSMFWRAIKKAELLFVNNPGFAKQKPLWVIGALYCKTLAELLINKPDDAIITIQKIENLPKTYKFKLTPLLKFSLFENTVSNKLAYYYRKRQFDEVMNEVPGILVRMNQFNDLIGRQKEIIWRIKYQISEFYFIDKQYKKSIRLLHSIITEQASIGTEVNYYATFLLFMAHCELKNKEIFNYLLKIYPPKNGSIEQLILSFLANEFLPERSKKTLVPKLQKLKKIMIVHKGFEKLNSFFSIADWIESKIQNKVYKDILCEQ